MKRGATKEEIIRITQALIARNGIRAVRVDEIAQTLGISKRTLYEMFADKDDLINACLDAMSSKQRERIATYRKRRSGSALQRTFKLAYEYIANLYMVESSFLSDLRHKIIYADHSTNTASSGAASWRTTSKPARKRGCCFPKSRAQVLQTAYWRRFWNCGSTTPRERRFTFFAERFCAARRPGRASNASTENDKPYFVTPERSATIRCGAFFSAVQ